MGAKYKKVVWLQTEISAPPFSVDARREAGYLIWRLQEGERLSMPHSRPMTKAIGSRCHELRISDKNATWRIIYRIDPDAILILEIFKKKSNETPQYAITNSKQRQRLYDSKR